MDKDREAFEAHIRSLLPHAKFDRDDCGEYIAVMVNARWMGWQAALAYVRGEREEVHPFAQGVEFYPLDRCYVWRRESTQEWVLELNGEINDCFFTSRHTQPLSVKPEDVPGLPTRYEERPEPEAPSPVTESSGCVFRDLNMSPPEREGEPTR